MTPTSQFTPFESNGLVYKPHPRFLTQNFGKKVRLIHEFLYVEWIIERGSKTRTGEHEFVPDRMFNPKMFATDGPRCPVKIFKEYLAR